MPDFVNAVFKHLKIPIPIKKNLPSELISLIEIHDIQIRLSKACPNPLITGVIRVCVKIPRGLRKFKLLTTEVEAEFYLLHPDTGGRIARLNTDGWQESSSANSKDEWRIQAKVTDAPVEIVDQKGFYDWIGMMLLLEEESMNVCVEGWCSAGMKMFGSKAKVERLPVKATLDVPGRPSLFAAESRNTQTWSIEPEMSK
jgi:hypothetical protein